MSESVTFTIHTRYCSFLFSLVEIGYWIVVGEANKIRKELCSIQQFVSPGNNAECHFRGISIEWHHNGVTKDSNQHIQQLNPISDKNSNTKHLHIMFSWRYSVFSKVCFFMLQIILKKPCSGIFWSRNIKVDFNLWWHHYLIMMSFNEIPPEMADSVII